MTKYLRRSCVEAPQYYQHAYESFQSEPNTESYSASKGGVVALTHALAASLENMAFV